MYGWHWDGMGWLGGLLVLIAMVVFWGGLLTAAVLVIRHFSGPRTASGAQRILDERFARGEIDAEEYAARRAKLAG
ncbi:SHOCT domain-containing protein [Actinokineospora soli]|uniref:SHOCT domain-containing protein n=1 Tax=Actinokineospora soli TaxID=1048753 RepID=A0ABW2TND7_9PSEU